MHISCVPDDFLSQAHLDVIYNEFCASLVAGDSHATVLASVVNNVRHVYMAALLRAREAELERLRRDHDPLPQYTTVAASPAAAPAAETPPVASVVPPAPETPAPSTGIAPAPAVSWPAKTFTLHIGSYSADHRRDMPAWINMDRDGWAERTSFEVYKFEEPGTIRVDVVEQHDTHRVMVNRNQHGWNPRLVFYAYPQPRPGTEYVWVAFRADPDRCLFLKGAKGDCLEGWERVLEFWVPV